MTHSLTHLAVGFKRTWPDQPGRRSPYFKPFPAAFRTPTDNLGLENGGPTRTRTWNQRIHVARRFRAGVDYLITLSLRWSGAGGSGLSSRALQPPGSLCTFRRCTAGSAQGCHQPYWKVSLNSSRSRPRITPRRHLSMSPLL